MVFCMKWFTVQLFARLLYDYVLVYYTYEVVCYVIMCWFTILMR